MMRVAAVWMVLMLVAGAAALAGPQNGFGLAGGVMGAANRRTLSDGSTQSFSSAGLSLAGDAQFSVDSRWSVNPYLQLSLEHVSGGLSGTADNAAAGVEARRWYGQAFLGARLGYYVELVALSHANGTGYGPGAGVSAGGETPGGFTWVVILDLTHVGVWGDQASLRLNLGRRWE